MMRIGAAKGIAIPAHPEALAQAGAAWLTEAFRAYGSLAADNAVTRITGMEAFHGGNSGDKLVLAVEYARAAPGLHGELFVKFSRCLGDPFRDRRSGELEAEVHLADLSRHPQFPVAVAKPCFAGFDPASGDGVLITERIRYGAGGIEPARAKNMDHQLACPEEYYRATTSALARLAAAYQSGRLSPEVDALFPYDAARSAAELPLAWNEEEVRTKAAAINAFIAAAPQLFPPRVSTAKFAARFADEAVRLCRHNAALRRFLHADPRFVALAHWNTHIDNAWFWRDAAGTLQAGLLDWGMVRPMNLALSLWGGLSGGNQALWAQHGDALIDHFLAELAAYGGHDLDPAQFRVHLDLSVGMVTLALMLDMPTMFLGRMPDVEQASGPDDPALHADKVVHGFLHTFGNAMALWERRDFAASLAAIA
jgi:hypothetical protein